MPADAPRVAGLAPGASGDRVVRAIAIGVICLKTAAVLALLICLPLFSSGQDPAGRAFVDAGLALGCLYWLVSVLPALILVRGRTRRGLAFALAWLLVPDALLAALAALT